MQTQTLTIWYHHADSERGRAKIVRNEDASRHWDFTVHLE
jgi:hypothetical protein